MVFLRPSLMCRWTQCPGKKSRCPIWKMKISLGNPRYKRESSSPFRDAIAKFEKQNGGHEWVTNHIYDLGWIIKSALFWCWKTENLHVNKSNFHVKGFALGLALKQRWKATRKSPINTGKRTEWSPIRSVIIRVITKSDDRELIIKITIFEKHKKWKYL